MSCIRQMIEQRERDCLSPRASLSCKTRGRERPMPPDDIRTEYQRDRDRIIHCKSFRRLMHKTQVFLSPEQDHYRTRLTHTLEVMQIGRTISRALMLNEDLCEAVALGHDLGHTPFGHAGESVLQKCYDPSFTHYRQSLRVVDLLENDGEGLNLTFEVRDGILNHTGDDRAVTLEGRIVKFADRIAYINHDIDDAIRAKVICAEDIPLALRNVLGHTHGERIDRMVRSVISASADLADICMEEEIGQATAKLREFMFENVYYNPVAKKEETKAKLLLEDLYFYFIEHPEKLPPRRGGTVGDDVPRRVCDYLAGMTDRFAIRLYTSIHIPEQFR